MEYKIDLCVTLALCVAWMMVPVATEEVKHCTVGPCNVKCTSSDKECKTSCLQLPCTQSCMYRDKCGQSCPARNCTMECNANKMCTSTCVAGGCSMKCTSPDCQLGTGPNMKKVTCFGKKCLINSEGTGSHFVCEAESCQAFCTKGDCTMEAKKATSAKLECLAGTACKLTCTKGKGTCECKTKSTNTPKCTTELVDAGSMNTPHFLTALPFLLYLLFLY